jgi:hypothetical protein
MPGIEQKFAVAFRTEYRTLDDADHSPAGLRGYPSCSALTDLAMDLGVAHDAAFADMLPAGLELRFDQGDQGGELVGEGQGCRQYSRKPDEAGVTGNHIDRLGNVGAGQMARVEPFADNDAAVLPQLPCELAMPDIDGINPLGAARQQHIGETAGRRSDVEGDATLGGDPEMVERVGELDAAAGNPGVIAPFEYERRLGAELLAGLFDQPPGAADEAGEDQCLCLRPAFRETLLDEQLIGPLLSRRLP